MRIVVSPLGVPRSPDPHACRSVLDADPGAAPSDAGTAHYNAAVSHVHRV
jgi:hypothetical protein